MSSDDRKFETVARVSDINLGLYRMFLQPWVRLWTNEDFAATLRRLHPLRLQYEMFSSANPFMRPLQSAIGHARDNRQPVSAENPLWQAQELFSNWTETWLDAYRDLRDRMCESTFDAVYGSPLLQALVGLKATDASSRRPGKDPAHLALVAQRIKELKAAIPEGGPREAAIRALLYLHQPDGVFDERGFNLLRRMREEAGSGMTLGEFKRVVREQFFMLLVDERRAVEAIPAMLAKDPALADAHASDGAADDRNTWSAQRRGTIALGRAGAPARGKRRSSVNPRATAFRQGPPAAGPYWKAEARRGGG